MKSHSTIGVIFAPLKVATIANRRSVKATHRLLKFDSEIRGMKLRRWIPGADVQDGKPTRRSMSEASTLNK
jgi:hypothetical protein